MEEKEIIKLYKEGIGVPEITEKTKYKSTTSVYNILEDNDIERRGKRECQHIVEIPENKLKELYFEEDMTLREISNIYDCNSETIRRLMTKYGIKRKDKTRNFIGWNKGLTKDESESLRKMAKKISETRKRMFDEGQIEHWNKGRSLSEETKEKISNSLEGKLVGRENPNWKGGADTEAQRIRRKIWGSRILKKWRKQVFERDNYKCQLCGKCSDGDLQAHHIIPLREAPNLVLDVGNGITLCESCHIHRVNNHEDEFFDYFKERMKENG